MKKMKYILALLLLSVFLVGCGTAGVVEIGTLESCWNEKISLQTKLTQCEAKPQVSCEMEINKINLLKSQVVELEGKQCPECQVCDVCSECEECTTTMVNETVFVNRTVVVVNETLLDECLAELNMSRTYNTTEYNCTNE